MSLENNYTKYESNLIGICFFHKKFKHLAVRSKSYTQSNYFVSDQNKLGYVKHIFTILYRF